MEAFHPRNYMQESIGGRTVCASRQGIDTTSQNKCSVVSFRRRGLRWRVNDINGEKNANVFFFTRYTHSVMFRTLITGLTYRDTIVFLYMYDRLPGTYVRSPRNGESVARICLMLKVRRV